jgi:hypothetical protein
MHGGWDNWLRERSLPTQLERSGGYLSGFHPRKEIDVGDRTRVIIEVLESDRDRVVDPLDLPSDEYCESDDPRTISLVFDEVDCGDLQPLSDLARTGLVFRGRHCEGDEYYGTTFAASDGIFALTPSPFGELMVRIDPETLGVGASDLAAARDWRDTENRVCAYFASRGQDAG